MKKLIDPPKRDRWALLRFSVIGTLMASPPEPGRLRDALLVLAAKTWRHPDSEAESFLNPGQGII